VPFVPARPPRLIFVGVTGRRLGTSELKRRSIGDENGVDFWASLPSAVRCPGLLLAATSILPWALPLAGFRARCRASRSGSTPIRSSASGEHARMLKARRSPIRSWVFGVLTSRQKCGYRENCSTQSHRCLLAPHAGGAVSPSLQRIDGADASPARIGSECPSRASSLSEVLHRP